MTDFLLILLICLVAFCSLPLYYMVSQLGTLIETIESRIDDYWDDDWDDDWDPGNFPRQPMPPDGMAKDIEDVRMDLARQFQKS